MQRQPSPVNTAACSPSTKQNHFKMMPAQNSDFISHCSIYHRPLVFLLFMCLRHELKSHVTSTVWDLTLFAAGSSRLLSCMCMNRLCDKWECDPVTPLIAFSRPALETASEFFYFCSQVIRKLDPFKRISHYSNEERRLFSVHSTLQSSRPENQSLDLWKIRWFILI